MRHDPDHRRLANPNAGAASAAADRDAASRRVWEYVDLFRRKGWIIAAAALLGVGGAWWNETKRVPVYTAEALLEQRGQEPVMGVGLGMGSADFVSQLETIRTRTIMTEVVDRLGLQLRVSDREAERSRIIDEVAVDDPLGSGPYTLVRQTDRLLLLAGREADEQAEEITTAALDAWIEGPGFRLRVADPATLNEEPLRFSIANRQAAVERLQRQIMIEPGRAPSLLRISFTSPDPEMAAEVVNRVADAYQNHRTLVGKEMASRRREVIAQQLVGLADSLQEAQAAVVEYQRDAQLLNPGFEGNQTMEQVLGTENELRTMRFQEGLLSSVVAGLQAEGDAADQSIDRILSLGGGVVPGGPELHRRLQDLQIERARMTASRFGRTEGDPEVEVVDSLITSTQRQIRSAAEQGLEHLQVQIDGAEERLAEARGTMRTVPGQTAELAQLRQRADAVQDVVDALVERYYEAQIAEAVEVGDIAVIDPAMVPLSPDSSPTTVMLLVGLIAGAMLGTLGAIGTEYADFRVRGSEDAEVATGLPLFGMIPKLRDPSRNPVNAAIARESFRSVRTHLNFAQADGERLLALTSATPREGKTTVAVNVAASLAEQQGSETVLLIDADLRRPQIHTSFEMSRDPGLTDVLDGTCEFEDAVKPAPLHPNLQVLSAGTPVSNPSEVIASAQFAELLHRLRTDFDFVVIDTPPLLAVTDSVVIAKLVEGTLIVVRADQTDRAAVSRAMEQLRRVDARLLGVILNAVDPKGRDGRYAYSYYYEDADVEGGSATDHRGRRPKRLLGTGSGRG